MCSRILVISFWVLWDDKGWKPLLYGRTQVLWVLNGFRTFVVPLFVTSQRNEMNHYGRATCFHRLFCIHGSVWAKFTLLQTIPVRGSSNKTSNGCRPLNVIKAIWPCHKWLFCLVFVYISAYTGCNSKLLFPSCQNQLIYNSHNTMSARSTVESNGSTLIYKTQH